MPAAMGNHWPVGWRTEIKVYGLELRIQDLGLRVQHLKSKHSFHEQLSEGIEEYLSAHWVPQHSDNVSAKNT